MSTGHPDMPEFQAQPSKISNIVRYLNLDSGTIIEDAPGGSAENPRSPASSGCVPSASASFQPDEYPGCKGQPQSEDQFIHRCNVVATFIYAVENDLNR